MKQMKRNTTPKIHRYLSQLLPNATRLYHIIILLQLHTYISLHTLLPSTASSTALPTAQTLSKDLGA